MSKQDDPWSGFQPQDPAPKQVPPETPTEPSNDAPAETVLEPSIESTPTDQTAETVLEPSIESTPTDQTPETPPDASRLSQDIWSSNAVTSSPWRAPTPAEPRAETEEVFGISKESLDFTSRATEPIPIEVEPEPEPIKIDLAPEPIEADLDPVSAQPRYSPTRDFERTPTYGHQRKPLAGASPIGKALAIVVTLGVGWALLVVVLVWITALAL